MSRVVGWLGPFNLTTCKNRLFIARHALPTPVFKQRIPYSFFSSRHVDRADTSFQTFEKCQLTDSIASCGVDEVATCRSEEHTSELQSLMRISYAVFCLQKKRKTNTRDSTT